MDLHQLVELLFAGFGERHVDADAGVVDQVIEVRSAESIVELGRHLMGEGGEAAAFADIQLQHDGTPAVFLDFRGHCPGFVGLAAIGTDDVDALGGEMQGGVLAEATAGAGDEGDLAVHAGLLVAV
ncbi:hypothetical protein D3C80_932740 [compost metagenome]